MEFWIIMIVFICIGGSCSLAGTWWSKKRKIINNNKTLERIIIIMIVFFIILTNVIQCYIINITVKEENYENHY